MVEADGLENRYTRKGIVGSNPTLSAKLRGERAPHGGEARRTTHRSRTGKKLYAVRDSTGRFKDIQTYERAHRSDLARKSKAEVGTRGKKKKKRRAEARSAPQGGRPEGLIRGV